MAEPPPLVVLVASALLGPAVWRPVAAPLAAHGWDVDVVGHPARAPRTPGDVLEHLLAHVPGDRPVALVAHSNAGLYVPAVAARRPVVASVLADAALAPRTGAVPLAPAGLREHLAALADDDGLLPPWTRWWDETQLAALFPDAATRAAVEAEQHRLPVRYFAAELTVPAGWAERPAAYLAFGDTYAAERERAARWGWPVLTLPGGHLHTLVDPVGVAAAVDALLRRLLDAPVGGAGAHYAHDP